MTSSASKPPGKSHGLQVTATWRRGDRTRAWDALWRHILEDMLKDAHSSANADSGHVHDGGPESLSAVSALATKGCDVHLESEGPR